MKDTTQGEWRSHGFFFKGLGDDTGILGLPIRTTGYYESSLYSDSASVTYLKVNEDKKFSKLGNLQASQTDERNDDCEISCVDWYGNSRPIFYGDRIFALLGYELVEGKYSESEISLSKIRC